MVIKEALAEIDGYYIVVGGDYDDKDDMSMSTSGYCTSIHSRKNKHKDENGNIIMNQNNSSSFYHALVLCAKGISL